MAYYLECLCIEEKHKNHILNTYFRNFFVQYKHIIIILMI